MVNEMIPVIEEIKIKGFHELYYFELNKNFYHIPERHDFWEMVYVDYGTIESIVEGAGYTMTAGQVIFHKPMESHSHIANRKDASNVMVVSFSCDSPIMSFFDRKVFRLGKSSQKLLSLFLVEATNALGKICGDYNNRTKLDFSAAKPGSVQLMQCYLVEFLFSLIRGNEEDIHALSLTRDTRALAESSLSDSVAQYIHDHITDAPSLTLLCERFSVSRTYLCSIFKDSTGTSPVDYWINLKIKEAKKLIREGNWNITQISEHLGYSGIHHFTRMFKRVTGISPTDYKKSIH
jgi:AraC-like DNA-binding protein